MELVNIDGAFDLLGRHCCQHLSSIRFRRLVGRNLPSFENSSVDKRLDGLFDLFLSYPHSSSVLWSAFGQPRCVRLSRSLSIMCCTLYLWYCLYVTLLLVNQKYIVYPMIVQEVHKISMYDVIGNINFFIKSNQNIPWW